MMRRPIRNKGQDNWIFKLFLIAISLVIATELVFREIWIGMPSIGIPTTTTPSVILSKLINGEFFISPLSLLFPSFWFMFGMPIIWGLSVLTILFVMLYIGFRFMTTKQLLLVRWNAPLKKAVIRNSVIIIVVSIVLMFVISNMQTL